MIENYDWISWEAKMCGLETNWQDRMTDLRNEYKDQFAYLYGVSILADQEIPDSD
jgi:hypothetical protein